MVGLIILIGLPGSGKTTLATRLAASPDRLLISTDAIRAELFGDEAIQGPWFKVWSEVQRQFYQAVALAHKGQVFLTIYDATNVVRRQRRQVIALAKAAGFTQVTGLWLDVPLEVCLARNGDRTRQVPEDVIQRMHRRLTGAPPSLEEGLHGLLRYPSGLNDFAPSPLASTSQESIAKLRESAEITIANSALTEQNSARHPGSLEAEPMEDRG